MLMLSRYMTMAHVTANTYIHLSVLHRSIDVRCKHCVSYRGATKRSLRRMLYSTIGMCVAERTREAVRLTSLFVDEKVSEAPSVPIAAYVP